MQARDSFPIEPDDRGGANGEPAKLCLTSGLSNVSIVTHRGSDKLVSLHFRGEKPLVDVDDRIVTVRSQRSQLSRIRSALGGRREPAGEVSLRAGLPWSVRVAGGVSNVSADLRDVTLEDLSVAGGVKGVDVTLPAPIGEVHLRFAGGVTDVRLHRPVGVPLVVKASGGVAGLKIDERSFSPIGGGLDWHSPDFDNGAGYYFVEASGGVGNLQVDAY